jgi:hypothetical protein
MNIPESYYIGKEFFEDEDRIDVEIICFFSSAASIDIFHNKTSNWEATTEQISGRLKLIIKRKISKKLLTSLREKRSLVYFIIGYINEILPSLNEHVRAQKYLLGQILANTYSSMDVVEILINTNGTDGSLNLILPTTITPFPSSKQLARELDEIFIRDYIDAMGCYFNENYDECIRKVVTSLENFFIFKKVKGDFLLNPFVPIELFEIIIQKIHDIYGFKNVEIKRGTFNSKLRECLYKKNYPRRWGKYLQMWEENLKFIYKIRNGIIHKKYRLKEEDKWICDSAICTMSYFFQTALVDNQTRRYLFSLIEQFKLLQPLYQGVHIEKIGSLMNIGSSERTITNDDEMDEAVFSDLKIKSEEKRTFLSKFQ